MATKLFHGKPYNDLSTNPRSHEELMMEIKDGEVQVLPWYAQRQFHSFCCSLDKLRDGGRFRDVLDIIGFLGDCWCHHASPSCWPCEMAAAMLEGKDFRAAIQPFLKRKGETEAEVLSYWEKCNQSYDEFHEERRLQGTPSCTHCGNFLRDGHCENCAARKDALDDTPA